MRKIIVFLFLAALFLFGASYANAYSIGFDGDGTSSGATAYSMDTIYGFDLEGYGEVENLLNGVVTDTVIHQNVAGTYLGNGDTFSELITLDVRNSVDWLGNELTSYDNIFVDIYLAGFITNYNDGGTATTVNDVTTLNDDTYAAIFTGGNAQMYIDNDSNADFTSGDINVATFSLLNSAPALFNPSVFTGASATNVISSNFKFDTYNSEYWATTEPGLTIDQLVANTWLHISTEGSVKVVATDSTVDPAAFLIGVTDNGFDAAFNVVPEPSTFILLGFGLAGLGFYSRRRKK